MFDFGLGLCNLWPFWGIETLVGMLVEYHINAMQASKPIMRQNSILTEDREQSQPYSQLCFQEKKIPQYLHLGSFVKLKILRGRVSDLPRLLGDMTKLWPAAHFQV